MLNCKNICFICDNIIMASHKATKKSIRKAAKQRLVNISRLSRIKTFIKKVENLIAEKAEKTFITNAFSAMQKEMMRGITKKVMHKNTVARKISRMSKKMKIAISE